MRLSTYSINLDLPVLVPRLRHVAEDGHYFGYSGIVGDDLLSVTDQLSEKKRAEVGSTIVRYESCIVS